MRFYLPLFFLFGVLSCNRKVVISVPAALPERITGSGFYAKAAAMQWRERDSLALKALLAGHMPSFLTRFVPVEIKAFDSLHNKPITATVFVSPDYLSIGTDHDWARIPLTPMAAQAIADSFGCFLPTPRLVDAIYTAAVIKPAPVPLFAYRDSTPVMYHHHLIIEGQRNGRKGLIAGIKKDVVITGRLLQDTRPNRVAIYGWHKTDGQPVQPVYTGHFNGYVDYSHGVRLIWRKIRIGKQWYDYTEIMNDPVYSILLRGRNEPVFYRYDIKGATLTDR